MDTAEETRATAGVGITVVVIATAVRVVLILAALLVEAGFIAGDFLAQYSPVPLYPIGTSIGLISHGVIIGMLIVSLLCMWGLARRHPWGWTLSIVTAGIILALNIGWWAGGEPRYLSMLVNSIAVFYLNQRDLRSVFQVGEA
jgi:hypothetical protein